MTYLMHGIFIRFFICVNTYKKFVELNYIINYTPYSLYRGSTLL
jgi:hypothetical protein